METQAHANKRAGVEGAERLPRQQLNTQSAELNTSNDGLLMAARWMVDEMPPGRCVASSEAINECTS